MSHALAVLALFLIAPAARASWDDVSLIRIGQRTRITEFGGTVHSGTFAAVSPTHIAIRTGVSQEAIERARIQQIQARGGARRWRNLAIGAAIGLVGGVVIDATLGARFRNEGSEGGAARFASIAVPAAVFGGIGAALPGWQTVYRADRARP
jgi:hypothetical protein